MNIIFDLGGVVLDWNPRGLVEKTTDDRELQDRIYEALFLNPLWKEMDRGTTTFKETIDDAVSKSGIDRTIFQNIMDDVRVELTVRPVMADFIKKLSDSEHKIYVLSNMPAQCARDLENDYDIWKHFDGIVFSCDVNMIKPDDEIFEHIVNKYKLDKSETIFIDDTLVNVEASRRNGIECIHFSSPEALFTELTPRL